MHYGIRTPISILIAHIIFGAILGAFCSLDTHSLVNPTPA
jgi:hypothetical protein